jgi:hypothetical protein
MHTFESRSLNTSCKKVRTLARKQDGNMPWAEEITLKCLRFPRSPRERFRGPGKWTGRSVIRNHLHYRNAVLCLSLSVKHLLVDACHASRGVVRREVCCGSAQPRTATSVTSSKQRLALRQVVNLPRPLLWRTCSLTSQLFGLTFELLHISPAF